MMLHDGDIRDNLCLYLEEKYGEVRFFEDGYRNGHKRSYLWCRD